MSSLFEIRDLICSYSGDISNPVLTVSNLDIPAGEVIFLLGASGSGKSTLLELLGLMSDTRAAGTITLNTTSGQYNYQDLWREGNTKQLSAVRRSTLAFIFQNTNLMNNFSVYENICLSSMIQKNYTQNEAMSSAQDTLRRVGMPPEQIGMHTPASRLSGGQRQRVAFARALNSRPLVLFGDEPAGNLDEKNADDLLQVIRADLQNKSSAIIVSHDIRLALRHADRIICLHKPSSKHPATIRDSDVYPRSYWEKMNALEKESFSAQLRNYYHVNIENPLGNSKNISTETMAESYRKLFLRNEGQSLLGPAYSNLVRLVAIFLITLLAIGFANGSLEYLSIKLNNPFVNWLTVDIPYSRKNDLGKILERLQSSEVKNAYHIASVNLYKETSMYFFPWQNDLRTTSCQNINLGNIRYSWARTVSTDGVGDPLMNEVLHPDNILHGKPASFGKFDFGLVVTRAFLDSLGYPINTPVVYYKHRNVILPLTIKCVVRDMPGHSQIIMTEFFMKSIRQNGNGPFDLSNKTRFFLFYRDNIPQSQDITEKSREFFNQDERWAPFKPEVFDAEPMQDVQGGDYKQILVRLDFAESFDNSGKVIDSAGTALLKYLGKLKTDTPYRLQDFTDYGQSPSSELLAYDRISINFKDLEKVRDFALWFFAEFNEQYHHEEGAVFQADISKVREKENFYFLSSVAYIISFLVLVFGILAISLFITSMLITHLSKITMNIGTFKAFGLSDSDAHSIYFIIVLRFILISLIAGVLVAWGSGLVLESFLSRSMFVNEKIRFFLLFDTRTLAAIMLVLFFGLFTSWRTIRRMLNKTPGDLIYGRS